MAEPAKQGRLGRGLSALMGDADLAPSASADRGRSLREIPIEFLRANPFQPRQVFTPEDLDDLTNSIREKGIIQPIVVRPMKGEANAFQIVAGERRWRAAQRLGLHQVPVVVKDFSDAEALEVAIIENVQRADLNPVEEATGYHNLVEQFSYTQEQLAGVIGKSRSHIANTLRLLNLPGRVRDYLMEGKLTAGHARALITAEDPVMLADLIVSKGLSVREAEAATRAAKGKLEAKKAAPVRKAKDADTRELERSIAAALGLHVEIDHKGEKGGEVRIRYKTLDQLDEVCRRLTLGG
ncbi:MAG: ParB/RepB/Spo0J family partition protein [Alphaproteobacteria bacterium]|nr:ParB/RepB/Spo0J family partition protein [Alphaproteobacteria bacterium]